jgi:uncharacterized protein (TIGR02265 family)
MSNTPTVTQPMLTPVPRPATGQVKGTLVIARMKYLRSRGDAELERVVRHMSSTDQQVLRGLFLPSSWYPADLLVRLDMTAAALLARGERKLLFLDMGRFTADTNLGPSGIQRPYLKEGEPLYLLRNIPLMYSAQHTDGARTYQETSPRSATIRTVSGETPTEDDCLTATGWLKRAIELSGGRTVAVEETRCRARGGDCCEYVCRWA